MMAPGTDPELAAVLRQFNFDPTYGKRGEALRAVHLTEAPPKDFAPFWQTLAERARTVPLDLTVGGQLPQADGRTVEIIFYTVLDATRIGAWVRWPAERKAVNRVLIKGHGYGGRDGPDDDPLPPDCVEISPLAPGFQLSAAPGRFPTNNAAFHVIHGLKSRETYILRLCAAAIWRAVDAVAELTGKPDLPVGYLGWSFGGGIGALALPWEPRILRAELGQPTFGHQPFRLSVPCVGSGEAVRIYAQRRPVAREVLPYFDAAHAIQFAHQPVLFACSELDPFVPPPGQLAIYNAHPGPKTLSRFSVGHLEYEPPSFAQEWSAHEANRHAFWNIS